MCKKIIIILMVVLTVNCTVYGHVAKKDVQKDSAILELEAQVSDLIVNRDDMQGALKLYAKAARANREQTYYKDEYSILRRVIKMNKAIESALNNDKSAKDDQEKVSGYYQAVRAYCYDKGYYKVACDLDKKISTFYGSESAKANLLESYLVTGEGQLAKSLINDADISSSSAELQIMNALLKSRDGKDSIDLEEMMALEFNPQDSPRAVVYQAAIQKLSGDVNGSLASIVKALENTAPTQMNTTRVLINNIAEFNNLKGSDQYVSALQTESKVYQSGCTGGSSCNSCSLKDSCSANQ